MRSGATEDELAEEICGALMRKKKQHAGKDVILLKFQPLCFHCSFIVQNRSPEHIKDGKSANDLNRWVTNFTLFEWY